MDSLPFVSVVVVSYNSSKYIADTLESIYNQTYAAIELIISDDCSQDSTVDICEAWLQKNGERFHSSNILTNDLNVGISINLNRGLRKATGSWVKIIAGDDALSPECIEILIKHVSLSSNEIQLLHGAAEVYKDSFSKANFKYRWGNSELRFNDKNISPEEQFQILLRQCPILAPTVFIKRSVFSLYGYFDENIPLWEDRPMWLKLTESGLRFYYIDEVLAFYRVHSESVQFVRKREYFNKYQRQRDQALMELFMPNLTFYERVLYYYMIMIRRLIIVIGLNRQIRFTHYFYSALTILAERRLVKYNQKYI